MRKRIKVGDHIQRYTGEYLGEVLAVYNTVIRYGHKSDSALARREDIRKCKKPRD